MNDRFKFRVWDKIHKKYIYCDFVGFCSVDKSGKGLKKIIFRPSGIDQLLNDGKIFYANEEDVVIEQCTGLRDKNGKLLYEGDIIRHHYDYGKVEWNYHHACFMLVFNDGDNREFGEIDMDSKLFEVIGSVHENPELLESEE